MQENILNLRPIKYINGTIELPGSKSISNRALLIAAQAVGTTILINLLNSDDVHYMLDALKKLGIKYRLSQNCTNCEIDGISGPLKSDKNISLFLGNAGTAMRPLAAALSICSHEVILTGELRMQERPIEHLITALRQGGGKIHYLKKENYPPICLFGGYRGGNIIVNGSISSQFLSSLLMMAPLARENTDIQIQEKLVSKPYIDITVELMKKFRVLINNKDYHSFYIQGNRKYYSPGLYSIEGDASSASYFLAAAAIRGGTVRITGIGSKSIQGDIDFARILKKMGAKINICNDYIECTKHELHAIDMDVNHIPDSAMTLAIIALFIKVESTTLRNIYNWRVKETDRLKAMAIELRKVGAIVIEGNDYLKITPPTKFISAIIDTYNDHRIAMCFSLLALSDVSIKIRNPQCVNKTFPKFFKKLETISNY